MKQYKNFKIQKKQKNITLRSIPTAKQHKCNVYFLFFFHLRRDYLRFPKEKENAAERKKRRLQEAVSFDDQHSSAQSDAKKETLVRAQMQTAGLRSRLWDLAQENMNAEAKVETEAKGKAELESESENLIANLKSQINEHAKEKVKMAEEKETLVAKNSDMKKSLSEAESKTKMLLAKLNAGTTPDTEALTFSNL